VESTPPLSAMEIRFDLASFFDTNPVSIFSTFSSGFLIGFSEKFFQFNFGMSGFMVGSYLKVRIPFIDALKDEKSSHFRALFL
jgi:hypothetical protein